jgi:mannosylglycerate hydrolase
MEDRITLGYPELPNESSCPSAWRYFQNQVQESGIVLLEFTEYEMRDDPDKTLYLTLFRAMGNMIVTWWEAVRVFPGKDGSRLLRNMELENSIYPYRGNWEEGRVYREAEAYSNGLFAYQVRARASGRLSRSMGFLVLRLFNPGSSDVSGRIAVALPATRAWKVDLGEKRTRETETGADGIIQVEIPAGRIFSVEVD